MDEKLSRVDPKLLELLVCPLTKGRLSYDREHNELVSEKAVLPIRSGTAFRSCWFRKPEASKTKL